MKDPVYVQVERRIGQPGMVNGLMVRMKSVDGDFDKYCAISDADNKASQLQMFKSLVQMCEEVSYYPLPVPKRSDI